MTDSLKTPSLDQIRQAFNTACEREELNLKLTGAEKILKGLSLLISDMRKLDIPVSLMLYGEASEDAIEIIRSNIQRDKNGNRRVIGASANGIIHIGNEQRLFSICTSIEKTDVLSFYLSKNNYAGQGVEARIFNEKNVYSNITAHEYDFGKNPDTAMAALAHDLIKAAAKYSALEKCDIAGIFEKTPNYPIRKKTGITLRKD